MKSYFPKQLLLSGMLLALKCSFLNAQTDSPYYLEAPAFVCDNCFHVSVQGTGLNSINAIGSVEWTYSRPPNFQTSTILEYCTGYSQTGTNTITVSAVVHASTGNYAIGPVTITVLPCDDAIYLTSNASQLCPAGILPPSPVPASGFSLNIGDADNLASGEHICLPVTVRGFSDILGMQFSIHYDPVALHFSGPTQLDLPGLASASFGIPGPGIITFTWNDPDVSGVTRPNGDTIFFLCFDALLPGPCPTEIIFENTPSAIEILNGDLDNVPFQSKPGRVQINGSGIPDNNFPGQSSCCEQVCAGSKVKYTFSSQASLIPGIGWSITGASGYTFTEDYREAEVWWGAPGNGFVWVDALNKSIRRCVNILAVPEASFTADGAQTDDTLRVCQGQFVAFSNTSSTEANSYHWQFGNGRSSTEPNPVHSWKTPGSYQMMLIAYNACLCADTSFLNVVVTPATAPEITCRGTVCEGDAVMYTADADCGTFHWEVSSNGVVTDGGGTADNFITIDWQSGPEGTIELQVENCATATYCSLPNVLRVPIIMATAAITGPEVVCQADVVQYTFPSFGGVDYTWSVSPGGTILSGQGTSEITVRWSGSPAPEAQWVKVEYHNCYLDCGGMAVRPVFIRPEFQVIGSLVVCPNSSQNYYVSSPGSGAFSCYWQVLSENGSLVWSAATPGNWKTIPWNFGPGIFQVVARPVNTNNFCIEEYKIRVQVFDSPPAPTGLEGESVICPGLNYSYTATGILPNHTAIWRVSGIAGSTALTENDNPIVVQWKANVFRSIRVWQSSPQGCLSDTLQLLPTQVPALSISGDQESCTEEITHYQAPAFDQLHYEWAINPSDAGTIMGSLNATAISVLWHKPGPATVQLSACGQEISFAVLVHPKPAPQVIHPHYLCPGRTTVVQTPESYTSYRWSNENGVALSSLAAPLLPAGRYALRVTNEYGCSQEVNFNIEGYPNPDIGISTPNNTGICPGDPPSTLFALNTADGYVYQWFRNGSPLSGATDTTYTTAQTGAYQVQVTDQNGCAASSDTLLLFHYCSPWGGGGGFPCTAPPGHGHGPNIFEDCEPNTVLGFDVHAGLTCEASSYTNTSSAFVPGTLTWNFNDPASGAANNSNLENPSHTFSTAGFFAVYVIGQALDPDFGWCYAVQVDTVLLKANFYFEQACTGSPVNFFDASTFLPIEGIASWSWNFGDPASGIANTSNAQHPMHVYTAPGNYTVSLLVTSTGGCQTSLTKQVEVFPLPAASFELPEVSCAEVALSFTATGDTYALQWTFGDPASGAADTSALAQPFHRYTSPGTYEVALQVTNFYGCQNMLQQSLSVTPNELGGDLSFVSPICSNDSSLMTASPGGSQWLWSNGATTESFWAHDSGLYAVTVTSENGCKYSPAEAVLVVLPEPNADIRAIRYNDEGVVQGYQYDSLSVCLGEDVFLEIVNGASTQTYLWNNGEAGSRIEFSRAKETLLPAGEHDISVNVTETTTGCVHTERFRVTVRPLPDLPVIAALPSGPVCEGTFVIMNVDQPQAGVSYEWSSGQQGAFLETALGGEYQVIATNEWGCKNASDPHVIFPAPDISFVPSGCYTHCRPDLLCLPAVPGVVSYQWFFNDAPLGGVTSVVPNRVAQQSGTYHLHMVTDAGCALDSDPLILDLFDGFGSIQGQTYWDLNNNGFLDGADSLIANVPIILTEGNVAVDTVFSQPDGYYGFSNIPAAVYGVQLSANDLPPGLDAFTLHVDTLLTGCDDEVLLNWRFVCTSVTNTVLLRACQGTFVSYGDTLLLVGTTTTLVATYPGGCTHSTTVTVQGLQHSATLLSLSACTGDAADYNGTPLPAGSTTAFVLTNAAGCDSTVTVTVNTLPTSATAITLSACANGSAIYNGIELSAGTITDFVFTNAAGCDSTVTVTVAGIAPATGSLTLSACPGSSVSYQGVSLAQGTVTDFVLTSAAGCDSMLTVTVNASLTSTLALSLQACPDGHATYQGQALAPGTSTDFVFINAAGCDSIVTVAVTAFALPEFEWETSASCASRPTGSIAISGQNLAGYALSDGPMQAEGLFSNLPANVYTIAVEDVHGCRQTQQAEITALPPLQIAAGNTVFPCDATSLDLEVYPVSGDDGNVTFLWGNGLTTAQRTVDTAGEYRVLVINNCDTLVQSVQVSYASSADVTPLYVPNAFSPNGDGINDRFVIFSAEEVWVQEFELMVFDRWGNQLFYTNDIAEGWDGLFRGRALDQGVFVWWMNARVFHCGQTMELKKKGDVTIVR